jgi:hypothetical protein
VCLDVEITSSRRSAGLAEQNHAAESATEGTDDVVQNVFGLERALEVPGFEVLDGEAEGNNAEEQSNAQANALNGQDRQHCEDAEEAQMQPGMPSSFEVK